MMVLTGFDVKDKVIVVTGSSSGIGNECARNFLKLGAKVCINGRNEERLNVAIHELKEQYRDNVIGVVADGRKEDEVRALIGSVMDHFGKIDVLINNAGGSFPIETEKLSSNGFNAVVQTNLTTVFHFSKAVLPYFKEQGRGKIINISSIAGLMPTPMEAHYGSSKAAVNQLTESLAQEWGKYNIQVNAIAPGPIMTKKAEEHLWADDQKKRNIEKQIALGRIGHPIDVFYACLYLSSSASDYVTGTILKVDGGARGIMG
jgi:NAD(P)-dependent dehydrogenase (short-subunit alcohol dehydrogenase family)